MNAWRIDGGDHEPDEPITPSPDASADEEATFSEWVESKRARLRAMGFDDYITESEFGWASDAWDAALAHARRNQQTDEAIRRGVRTIKQRFTAWRIPPVELPAEHVIEQSVRDIIADVLRGEG